MPLETNTEGHGAAPQADSPAEAEGRRSLSTAFVRLGPGEHLTVELHDGSLTISSNVGSGTVVVVKLPRERVLRGNLRLAATSG